MNSRSLCTQLAGWSGPRGILRATRAGFHYIEIYMAPQ